MQQKVVS
jgi:hypothetical protein